jgi:hypothetical protein
MRRLTTVLVAAAALCMSGAALAQTPQSHLMTVRLPDGGLAQIRYTGAIAPQVTISDAVAPVAAWAPLLSLPSLFGPQSPFAAMERISAEMDREAETILRRADALAAGLQSGSLSEAAMRALPPGSQSYSVISTMSAGGVCSRSVEITAEGNGAPPQIVRHSAGDCGPSGGTSGSVNLPTAVPPSPRPGPAWTNTPAPASRPDILWTGTKGATPYGGLVREIPTAPR